jgi:hypothetical protein
MAEIAYMKFEKLSIKDHSELNEKWVQDIVSDDPSILGLGGELVLKDKERIQPVGGRLDLLFQDFDSSRRYEVEIQLGKTDESHIIRTIEYWDIERKRYPQYEHTAIIVAEDITSRFLNVISLFNGFIPLVAIQMVAVKVGKNISLIFTKVLDQMVLGLEEEDEPEPADRTYWEKRGTKATVGMADEVLEIIKEFAPGFELKYNKYYIGLAKEGKPNNFAIFRPQKNAMRLEVKLGKSEDVETKLDEAGLDVMEYLDKWGRYRVRLTKGDIKKHAALLKELLEKSHNETAGTFGG